MEKQEFLEGIEQGIKQKYGTEVNESGEVIMQNIEAIKATCMHSIAQVFDTVINDENNPALQEASQGDQFELYTDIALDPTILKEHENIGERLLKMADALHKKHEEIGH